MSTTEEQSDRSVHRGARSRLVGRPPMAPCGTVAAYRRHLDHREPTCELCRLAVRADQRFRRNRANWQRSDRFAWLLHRAVLDDLLADPTGVLNRVRMRLASQRRRPGAREELALWDRWSELLDGPIADLAAVMLGVDEDAKLMRSTTPFVGVVDDVRRAGALAASKRT